MVSIEKSAEGDTTLERKDANESACNGRVLLLTLVVINVGTAISDVRSSEFPNF